MAHSRLFDMVTDHQGKPFAAQIVCAKCGSQEHSTSKGVNINHMAHEKKFQRVGWLVGNSPKKDICPACQKPNLRIVPDMNNNEPAAVILKAVPDAPRTMSRDERRIINDKLDEVYATNRYVPGWSDKKLAQDLGVPSAWIAEVRDAFHGPENLNTDMDDLRKGIEELKRLVPAAHEMVARYATAIQKLTEKLEAVERLAHKIEKDFR